MASSIQDETSTTKFPEMKNTTRSSILSKIWRFAQSSLYKQEATIAPSSESPTAAIVPFTPSEEEEFGDAESSSGSINRETSEQVVEYLSPSLNSTDSIEVADWFLGKSFTGQSYKHQQKQVLVEEKIALINDEPMADDADSVGTIFRDSKSYRPDSIKLHVITSATLWKTDWSLAYESLSIRSCSKPIYIEDIQASSNSLLTLKFSRLTSTKCLLPFLLVCRNLRKMSFVNVKFRDKRLHCASSFQLPNLVELQVTNWLTSLNRHDYWLLDFFVQHIECPILTSLTFRGTEDPSKVFRGHSKASRKPRNPNAVMEFLLKTGPTLKTLSVGGLGFTLFYPKGRFPVVLSKLKLRNLTRLDVPLHVDGIREILQAQESLVFLKLTGALAKFDRKTRSAISNCVENNAKTLKFVEIVPCILSSNMDEDESCACAISCDIFTNCHSLNTLTVNMTCTSPQRPSCGRLTNLQALPSSLKALHLCASEFDQGDLEPFFRKVPKLVCLKTLVLSSDYSENPYVIKLTWIKSLFGLPPLRSCEFFGGKIENMTAIRDFVYYKPRGYLQMIKTADGVSFHREQVYEPGVKWSEGVGMGGASGGGRFENEREDSEGGARQNQSASRFIRSNYLF